MAFINTTTNEVNCKIVYNGTYLAGKTTNLQFIAQSAGNIALKTTTVGTDKAIFFDFLAPGVEPINGFKFRFHLYAVIGAVTSITARKTILKGADGCVFVADSRLTFADSNRQHVVDLRNNLAELGIDLLKFPHAVQYNKRDLPGIVGIDEMRTAFNVAGVADFPAIASTGAGVLDTFKSVANRIIADMKASVPTAPT